jgi:hypothetical protein
MADSADAGIKRATGALSATEPAAKRQATEASVLGSGVPLAGANAVVSRGAATAEMAAELKKKVKEALARRKQLLEQELQHLEAGGKLSDFAATVSSSSSLLALFFTPREYFRIPGDILASAVRFHSPHSGLRVVDKENFVLLCRLAVALSRKTAVQVLRTRMRGDQD